MLKKLSLSILLTSLLLVGCGKQEEAINPPSHSHTYSTEWSYDESAHWHASTCGHNVFKNYALHTFSDWVIDIEPTITEEGLQHHRCLICNYSESESISPTGGESHTHTFSSSWSYDETEHWHASTCGHNVRSNIASHDYDEWVIDIEPTSTKEGSKHRNCKVCEYVEETSIPKTEEEETPSEIDFIQDMNILHAWNWKLNDIKARLKRIKKAGYGAIQISPMQPHVDGANGAKGVTQDNWWKLYQPLSFKVATGSENILGSKEDLTSLCSDANKEGLKIIVDVVCNHLAGKDNGRYYHDQVTKRYPLHEYIKNTDNSILEVVYGSIGLPDLDTSNSELQQDVLNMLKEYIDTGVSGFRFDAAKHIETPDDGEYASNFWPFVLGGATSYAISKNIDTPYYYGEILGTCGKGRSFTSYSQYMSVVDSSQGVDVLDAVKDENESLISSSYKTKLSPDKLVLWAESHDNYANFDNTTRDIDVSIINKAYVMQASRKDAATLYYARPDNMGVSMTSISDTSGWQSEEVKAINKFHDRYIDKSENVYEEDCCFINVRGSGSYAGAVIVNIFKDPVTRTLTINELNDGKYIDLVSKQEINISNHQFTVDFAHPEYVLIPESAYVPEEENPSYVSSIVIEDAPSTYTYIAWVWNNNYSYWKVFSSDNKAIGISLSSGDQFTIVEFPLGTNINNASWDIKIRQTVDMSYSGSQLILSYNSLSWI